MVMAKLNRIEFMGMTFEEARKHPEAKEYGLEVLIDDIDFLVALAKHGQKDHFMFDATLQNCQLWANLLRSDDRPNRYLPKSKNDG
jgi:hypothetical protein